MEDWLPDELSATSELTLTEHESASIFEAANQMEQLVAAGGRAVQFSVHDVPLSALDDGFKLYIVEPGTPSAFLVASKTIGAVEIKVLNVKR